MVISCIVQHQCVRADSSRIIDGGRRAWFRGKGTGHVHTPVGATHKEIKKWIMKATPCSCDWLKVSPAPPRVLDNACCGPALPDRAQPVAAAQYASRVPQLGLLTQLLNEPHFPLRLRLGIDRFCFILIFIEDITRTCLRTLRTLH